MKRIFIIGLLMLGYGLSFVHAQDVIWSFTDSDNVTFEWTYNFKTEPNIIGFNIVCSNNTNSLVQRDVQGRVTKYVWENFPLGYYYCFIVAYDKFMNSSVHSDVVGVGRKISKQLDKPGNVKAY